MKSIYRDKKRFLEFSPSRQHKLAADLLRSELENGIFSFYPLVEQWLTLPSIPFSFEEISDRFHLHLRLSGKGHREHNLLVRHTDKTNSLPLLPLFIYLDDLRSAFNVGSIIRTTEAFRLGTLVFSENTPFIDNPKVQKTAMGAAPLIPCIKGSPETLPRPWIALETHPDALSVSDASLPPSFSLLLGNEEYGLRGNLVKEADLIIHIPLRGSKNSLNVATAYGIVAGHIASKLS